MFMISWQLSILAFISVPVITVLSKWYGQFVRSLTKLMQSKLAEGNSVSEAAISSMPTVRAFDAALTEYKEFEECMNKVRTKDRVSCNYSFIPDVTTVDLVLVYSIWL
jgi:ABC-type multidrug transport system fused ATPase/permease subunit